MTKQPSYRFAGYTEPWKEKKLGEVADFTKGKGYSKGDLESSGVPIILYGRLYTNYQTIIDDVDTYVTMKEHSVLSEGNEIIVPSSGESSEEISRASVVAKKGVILGGDLNIIRLTEKFSSVFVAITLSNGSQQKELSKRAQGKSVVHLHNSDLKEVNLFYTSLPEQTAIGSFFQDIDQLISLQQRKLEVLKEQKKTYLKLLFPAKGQTKPALRFAGFEDEWKEVKLGEVTNIKTGGRDVQDSVEDGLYPFYIRSEEVKRINSYSFDGEAILIPGEGRLGEIFHYVNGKFDVHQRVYKISNFTDVDAKFILQQMKKDFKQHAMRNTVKATVDSLRLPTIQSFNIFVPTLPEQEAIGSFFQDLDKTIAKQEGKVNQLKESKQTLLRKMFI